MVLNRKITSIISTILVVLFVLMSLNIIFNGLGNINFIYTALCYFMIFKLVAFSISKLKLSQNILLLATSIIISLFVVELTLRFVLKKNLTYQEQNGSLGYSSFYIHSNQLNKLKRKRKRGDMSEYLVGIPNSTRKERKKEYTYQHSYNSIGLRDNEIELPKPKNEYRVIGLGDSFTEGLGAPKDSSWVELLKASLIKRTAQDNFNCINAGIAGSDPVFEYQLMANKLIELKPDLVLLALNGTDARDIFLRGGHDRYDEKGNLRLKTGPWWEYFYGTSFIVRYFVRDILKYNDYLVKDEGFEQKLQQAFDVIFEVIMNFHALSQKHQFEFRVVFMPFYQDMYKKSTQLDPIYQYLSENKLGGKTIYLPPCYSNYMSYYKKEPLDFYWEVDSHHNSKGYEMMAECIAESILN